MGVKWFWLHLFKAVNSYKIIRNGSALDCDEDKAWLILNASELVVMDLIGMVT